MTILEPPASHSFESDQERSLSPSNTSVAVRLLHEAWPARQWLTTCNTTDQAGCDLLGVREDRPPIRIDLKVRRGPPKDPANPDTLFDVQYVTGSGAKLPGPLFRPDPPSVDFYLFCWPDADPQVGVLVETRRTQYWLREYGGALRKYTTHSDRASGDHWTTSFVVVPVELLNERAGSNVARVLALTPVCYSSTPECP